MTSSTELVGNSHRKAIQGVITALLDLLTIYGYSGKRSALSTENRWLGYVEETNGKWMKVVKYKLAAYFSSHMNQPLPKKPFNSDDRADFLVGGGAGRFMRAMVKSKWKVEFLTSIKNGLKKGTPRPDTKLLEQAEIDFTAFITQEDPPRLAQIKEEPLIEWGDIDERLAQEVSTNLSYTAIEKQLRRTVREIYLEYQPGKNKNKNKNKIKKPRTFNRLTFQQRIKAVFPSTSANYINNRKKAGTVGTLLDHPNLMVDLRVPGGTGLIKQRQEEEEISNQEIFIDPKNLNARYKKLWQRCLVEAIKETPDARPVALAEPLKTRVITAMPPFQQLVVRPIWSKMHRILRAHPAFTLIGKPVTAKYLLERLGYHLKDDELYVSGDYEAATDNLYSEVSEIIASEIGEIFRLIPSEKEIFKTSLTGLLIDDKLQTRGQLMGSVTSFPVLCIANATVTRWALEISEKRKYTLRDAKLMINGDDVLFRGKKGCYELWAKLTNAIGLKESVGKTYVSREFVEINSTIFTIDRGDPDRFLEPKEKVGFVERLNCFKQSKYVNLGLLYGLKRSQGRTGLNDQTRVDNNLAARSRKLIEFGPERLKEVLMKRFIKHHRKLLEKAKGLPWFIPTWLGGWGLPSGSWGEPSELDRRLARSILFNWKLRRPIEITRQDQQWQTWEGATSSGSFFR
jgi:hypothetical protein